MHAAGREFGDGTDGCLSNNPLHSMATSPGKPSGVTSSGSALAELAEPHESSEAVPTQPAAAAADMLPQPVVSGGLGYRCDADNGHAVSAGQGAQVSAGQGAQGAQGVDQGAQAVDSRSHSFQLHLGADDAAVAHETRSQRMRIARRIMRRYPTSLVGLFCNIGLLVRYERSLQQPLSEIRSLAAPCHGALQPGAPNLKTTKPGASCLNHGLLRDTHALRRGMRNCVRASCASTPSWPASCGACPLPHALCLMSVSLPGMLKCSCIQRQRWRSSSCSWVWPAFWGTSEWRRHRRALS